MKSIISRETVICLDCLKLKAEGKPTDSLTYFFAVCHTCGNHAQVCTKVKTVYALRKPRNPKRHWLAYGILAMALQGCAAINQSIDEAWQAKQAACCCQGKR